MGLLFIGALAGILISLGWLAPSQGYYPSCAAQPCFGEVGGGGTSQTKQAALGPASATAKATPVAPAKSGKSPSAGKRAPVDLAKAAPPKNGVAAADRAADTSEAILNKAKAAIAGKMEDPESAEFSDVKRAMRKNTLGRAVDTICGHVKGRYASGRETGQRPFLYLVKEGDAYVVDGKADAAAAIAYRNICN